MLRMILGKISNAAISEALVSGQTINWNCFQATDRLKKEQINLSLVEEIEKPEEDAVERNAWRISDNIATRISSGRIYYCAQSPRSFPDISNFAELHYFSPDETPLVNSEGTLLEPDDYHPTD